MPAYTLISIIWIFMKISDFKQCRYFRQANATAVGLGTVAASLCIVSGLFLLYRYIYKLD